MIESLSRAFHIVTRSRIQRVIPTVRKTRGVHGVMLLLLIQGTGTEQARVAHPMVFVFSP